MKPQTAISGDQMWPVLLDWSDVLTAAMVGCRRHVDARVRGRCKEYRNPDNFQIDIDGACGEMAVAQALGLFWSASVGRVDAADVGGMVEVRSTVEHHHRLIIKTTDADGSPYVLVTGAPPRFLLRGWIFGADAKRREYWKADAPSPAFFGPHAALRPMPELVALLRKE